MNTSKVSDSIDNSNIAIIGMSCRFPGTEDIDGFWQNLRDGMGSISFFSDEELASTGVDPALRRKSNYVKANGVLSDIDLFDAFFFDYSPREAEMMDPQHRLFLECAWQAIEDVGCAPEIYNGVTGVYAGASMNTYLYNNLYRRGLLESKDGYRVMVASDKDFLATKVSYKLNLGGPSITVQTACSTSLVAVCLACQSLQNGECDMALAGGISVRVPHKAGYLYQEGLILSPDGHCHPFDARANGTVTGSGMGVVVLKRLEDAIAEGDHIYAIIKGTAVNNDGSVKAGYTAPGLDAQAAVICEAQGVAGIIAESISYIETHGTGTLVGDPIEIAALTKAFRAGTDKKSFCAIGSVKSNIGHLDAAAGIASLIKTVLALKHKQIPPSLNFEEPNPEIDFANSPFYVNTTLTEWKANGSPRRAGVSSFGIGGTNAHVVLEEAPPIESSGESRPTQLLMLSAKTNSALDTTTVNLAEHLRQHTDINLADVAYTLQIGRKIFDHRRVVVCQDVNDAATLLETCDPKQVLTAYQEHVEKPIVFMFSGQGAQYVNMAKELYQVEATFREQVELCSELLLPHLGIDLLNVLYPADEQTKEATEQLKQTAITQPALFVIEYALAKLWVQWGINPQAMIGHSIGEYVAACLAGVFSLEEALSLVAARGEMIQQLPSGTMLAIPLSEKEIQPLLVEGLSLAVINGSSRCVVSGPMKAVEALQNQLTQDKVQCSNLHTSHAFHSAMMGPILEPFTELVKKITLNPPQIPYISNVTGTWITTEQATDPHYWARHLRQTVQFANGLGVLLKNSDGILLEVGPGRTLKTLATQHPDKTREQVVLSSIRHPQEQLSDVAFLLNALGKLWLAGAKIDWSGFYTHEQRHRLPLPTYPFERQRYWIDPPEQTELTESGAKSSLTKKPDIADWFYAPSWSRSVAPVISPSETSLQADWLVFTDACNLGFQLMERLKQQNQNVISIKVGSEFAKLNEYTYTLNPQHYDDYDTLLNELDTQGKLPQKIVHLWNVTSNGREDLGLEKIDKSQDLGFYSLLFLAQALGKQNLTDDCHITVVSNNMHEVTGEEMLSPEKATLLGPVKVIPQEYENISCLSIDVVFPMTDTDLENKLISNLLVELSTKPSDSVIAYRGTHRWVQGFELIRLDQPIKTTSRLKKGGVYLITGGLGGIGLELSEYLARTVQAKLVLTGRSGLSSRDEWEQWLSTHGEHDEVSCKIRKVQELEKLGAEVMILCADVANLQQMQEAIIQVEKQFGKINGVIHAAGVPGGGIIQLKTREMSESIMKPKVKGTLILDVIFRDGNLDFLVLCSSTNSIIGRLGQVDYCAANAFLDAFAHHNTSADNASTICINWDTWKKVGMAAEAVKQLSGIPNNFQSQFKEVAHPLFDQCIANTNAQEEIYVTNFSANKHWMLQEHKIIGKAILPGTTYIEMVRAAFEKYAGDKAIKIRELYFLTPLIIKDDEEKEVHTVLRKREEAFEFLIMSRLDLGGDKWQEHARGKVSFSEVEPHKKHQIKNFENRCNIQEIITPFKETKSPSIQLPTAIEEDNESKRQFIELGPRWHSLKWVKLGENEGLAFLELSKEFNADIQSYKLHPALLDLATGFLRLFKEQSSYLPLSYKRLEIRSPLPESIYSYARCTENNSSQKATLSFDITIMDRQGTDLVEIEEFTMMRVKDFEKLRDFSISPSAPSDFSWAGSYLPEPLAVYRSIFQRDIEEGLLPAEGINVFSRVIDSSLSQVIVSPRDLPTRLKQEQSHSTSLLLKTFKEISSEKPKHPRPDLMIPYSAPNSEIEQRLADIWQEVLGVDQIGIHDNFFELGGDSLLMTQVYSKFKEKFDSDTSIANLLQYPTIADFAQFLDEKDDTQELFSQHISESTNKQKKAMKKRRQKIIEKRKNING
jgi:acyl transferase domain-containing protein/acyl carrier protein